MLRAGLDRSKGQGDFQVDPQLRSQGLEPPHWNLSRLHCMLGGVLRSLAPGRSPTPGLILGLIITLAAVVAYSAYITFQISGLRELQNNLVDRNRKDSLQLLRIQNDLNSLGLAMRDMLDADEPYPLTAWSAQFQRVRADLSDALRLEEQVAVTTRTPEQRQYLTDSVAQFWDAADRTFALARDGKEKEARAQIRLSLQARQAALSTAVARLLVQNNESEEQAAQRIRHIYDRVGRQVYLFLGATLIAIVLTSLYLIRSNRHLFAQLAALSEQRSELAQKLISTQESTLRYISRELHDEFGQILTAVGVMLDESGLESTLDWYIPTVERQAGIDISYEKSGTPFLVDGHAAIHIYRVLQEALNNVTRHSGAREAWVRLQFLPERLQLEVEDHGSGFEPHAVKQGIGLVAMRERAELLGGTIEFLKSNSGGSLVRLKVPREKSDTHAE